MLDSDRDQLVSAVRGASEERIVVTHGTDTLIQTAQYLLKSGAVQNLKDRLDQFERFLIRDRGPGGEAGPIQKYWVPTPYCGNLHNNDVTGTHSD